MTDPNSVTQQDVREPLDIAGIRARYEAATTPTWQTYGTDLPAALDRIEELERLYKAAVRINADNLEKFLDTAIYARMKELESQLTSSVERLKEMEADSKRLDWLGSQHTCVVTVLSEGHCLDHYLHGTDATIREAIDVQRGEL